MVDAARFPEDLRTGRIDRASGGGVVRTSPSEANVDARRWLRSRIGGAGLEDLVIGARAMTVAAGAILRAAASG